MPTFTSDATKLSFREAWTGDATFATSLLCLLIDTYGTEALQWSPETIRMEIQDDFNLILPDANFDRLMAAISLLTTDNFYWSLPDFIQICNVLNGDLYDLEAWDPADSYDMAWGISEAILINPSDSDDPFVPEICAYIGQVVKAEGIINPPDVLQIALQDTPTVNVHGEYSDDPVMFNAIYEFETSKTSAINEYVIGNIRRLTQQLEQLPLRVGTTRGVVAAVLKNLKADAASTDKIDSII